MPEWNLIFNNLIFKFAILEEGFSIQELYEFSPLYCEVLEVEERIICEYNDVRCVLDLKAEIKKQFLQRASRNFLDQASFVLCSDRILSKKLLDLDRSFFFPGKNKYARIDQSSIVQNLGGKRMFLEKSGVSCILMRCHISHCWHDEVAEGGSVPFLHIGECVAKELKEAKLRPLEAGSSLRIGVLATNATLTARFYQEKVQNEGFKVILPDKASVEHTLVPAVEALNRKDIKGAQNLFRIALQVLLVRAVNTVILTSDYVWELLPPNDPLWKKCIEPMDALARSTVKYAKSANRGKQTFVVHNWYTVLEKT